MNQLRPNFLIVGGARCGTTALYHFLKAHPQIGFPRLKEPRFFSSIHGQFPHNGPGDSVIDGAAIKGRSNYLKLFEGVKEEFIGEASPDYLYFHKDTVPEIRKELGDIKIIILLRDPVERAVSAYNHLLRDNREDLGFEEALGKEEERILKNYDFMWHYKKAGLYSQQVRSFCENFSKVKIIESERFLTDPKSVYFDVINFLGASLEFTHGIEFGSSFNPVGRPQNAIVAFFLRRDLWFTAWIREALKSMLPEVLLQTFLAKVLKKDQITDDMREQLSKFFEEDVQELKNITGLKFSGWGF